jgi:hypothetical protein
MRWDNLFDDLESQLEHELGVEDLELRVEEERLRLGRLSLRDRLRAASGVDAGRHRAIRLWLVDGSTMLLRPMTFGRDWLSGDLVADEYDRAGSQVASARALVPLDAIASVGLDDEQLVESLQAEPDVDASRTPEESPRLIDRLGLAFALRDLARRRSALTVTSRSGTLHGTIDRVARDHFDLALHDPGAPRRQSNVRGTRIVPMAALILVRV